MGGGDNERPAKRQKTKGGGGGKAKYRPQGHGSISASGLHSGDVGIFVTCDKGKEKACLREMEDLLSEELAVDDEGEDERNGAGDVKGGAEDDATETPATKTESGGIEDEIQKELAELAGEGVTGGKRKRPVQGGQNGEPDSTRKLGLVTLDIPCVSFVRFPSQGTRDPVEIATKLCQDARDRPEGQRSRFIKRLTPLSKVRKVMNGGVEQLCEDVLPAVFGGEDSFKYAVRVTVRNNNQVEKDQIIKTVAGAVRELGLPEKRATESKHRVDLKGYDRMVLVEIYRNVVGMAVVGAEWETLRRFNLSELYAEGRAAADKPAQRGQTKASDDQAGQTSLEKTTAAATGDVPPSSGTTAAENGGS